MLKAYGDVDSKFKFVLIAAKRAKQLLKGSKPKIKSKSKSLIRIAQQEVREGMVDYEIVQRKKEEEYKPDEEDFIGEEIGKERAAEEEIKRKSEDKTEEKVKSKSKGKKKQSK